MNTRPRPIRWGAERIPDEYADDVFQRAELGHFPGMTPQKRVVPATSAQKQEFEDLKVSIQLTVDRLVGHAGSLVIKELDCKFEQCQILARDNQFEEAISKAHALRRELNGLVNKTRR